MLKFFCQTKVHFPYCVAVLGIFINDWQKFTVAKYFGTVQYNTVMADEWFLLYAQCTV